MSTETRTDLDLDSIKGHSHVEDLGLKRWDWYNILVNFPEIFLVTKGPGWGLINRGTSFFRLVSIKKF